MSSAPAEDFSCFRTAAYSRNDHTEPLPLRTVTEQVNASLRHYLWVGKHEAHFDGAATIIGRSKVADGFGRECENRRTPMAHSDLFDLWRTMAGPQPGLYIPSSIRRAAAAAGSWFQVYLRRTDLDPALTSGDAADALFQLTSKCDGEYAIGNFALINNYLLAAPTTAETHAPLERYLSEQRLARMREYDAQHPVGRPNFRVVFSRMGCLVAIKLLLAARRTWGKAGTLEATDVGEIALLINDILKKDGVVQSSMDEALLFEFVGNWDISNTADISQTMSRADRMVRDHIWSSNATISQLRQAAAVQFERFEGATLEEHQTLSFSLYAVMSDAVLERGASVVHEEDVQSSLRMEPTQVSAFFTAHSADVETFASAFACADYSRERFDEVLRHDEVLLDMRMLRERPLLKLEVGRHLVLDLDYVIELSTAGLYWHFMAAAPSDTERQTLAKLWGYVFEEYCGVLVEQFYPAVAGLLHRDLAYGPRKKKVVVDAILNLGSSVVLFEFKASKLKTASIRSRDAALASAELEAKYVGDERRPRGVGQLARDAQALANGEISVPGLAPSFSIFPVLVTEERLMESFGVNRQLNRIFRSRLDEPSLRRVRPLTVMSVEELEFILPHFEAGVTSWPELLGSRFERDDVRPFSVYQTLWDLNREAGRTPIHNRYVVDRWEELFKRVEPFVVEGDRVEPRH